MKTVFTILSLACLGALMLTAAATASENSAEALSAANSSEWDGLRQAGSLGRAKADVAVAVDASAPERGGLRKASSTNKRNWFAVVEKPAIALIEDGRDRTTAKDSWTGHEDVGPGDAILGGLEIFSGVLLSVALFPFAIVALGVGALAYLGA